MPTPPLPAPVRFAGAFRYEHTDLPGELTLAAWRRQHECAQRGRPPRRPWRRVLRAVGESPTDHV